MKIKEIQDEIVDEFSMFDDWMERYEYIIQLGKSLPLIKDEFKTDSNVIKRPVKSMVARRKHDEKIVFTADSDAILTKGIIAILIRIFKSNPKSI
jgi:cysteine desulfuration protein SufE